MHSNVISSPTAQSRQEDARARLDSAEKIAQNRCVDRWQMVVIDYLVKAQRATVKKDGLV